MLTSTGLATPTLMHCVQTTKELDFKPYFRPVGSMSCDFLIPFVECIEELDILHLDGLKTLHDFFGQSRDGVVSMDLTTSLRELQEALRDCITTLHMLTTARLETLTHTVFSDDFCAISDAPKNGDSVNVTVAEILHSMCVLENAYENEFGVQDVLLNSALTAGNEGATVTSATSTILLSTWRAQTGLTSNFHFEAARKQLLSLKSASPMSLK